MIEGDLQLRCLRWTRRHLRRPLGRRRDSRGSPRRDSHWSGRRRYDLSGASSSAAGPKPASASPGQGRWREGGSELRCKKIERCCGRVRGHLFDGCLVAGLSFLELPGDFGKGSLVRVVARATCLPQGPRSPVVRRSVPRLRHFDFHEKILYGGSFSQSLSRRKKNVLVFCESEADAITCFACFRVCKSFVFGIIVLTRVVHISLI
jgi:hypothetical protein